MFIVLNEVGQVVTWQLTSSTSIDEVSSMLLELKCQILHPITVYVDNCCQLRPKLIELFGQDVTVSLDIFHAVQRLVRVMLKRHPMLNHGLRDLKLVFRSSSDTGKSRRKPTPDSNQIIMNLDKFVKKWQDCEINGWILFNKKKYML